MRARQNQVSTPNPEFGVDFDASARAMHQSALKGSLMVHETAFSTPAASRKSLGATLFERNTMLKTLKRKIALVAVAALGSAGLAVVAAPAANAAFAAGTLTLSNGSVKQYVGAPFFATVTPAGADDLTNGATVTHLRWNATAGVPAIGTPVVTGGVAGNIVIPAVFAEVRAAQNLVATYDENGAVADADPVGAGTATLANVEAIAAPTLAATVGAARVNSGQTVSVSVTGTNTILAAIPFKYANISKPTGANDLVLTDTLAADTNLSTATAATAVGTLVAPSAAGTYTGVVYQDTNANSTVDPGEPSSYVSITTSGAPSSATLTPATESKAAGAAATYTLTLKDANGVTTQAAVGEFFTIAADPTSAVSLVTIVGTGLNSISTPTANTNTTAVVPFTALGDGSEAFTVASDTAGDSVAIAVSSSGALRAQGVAASLTATLSIVAASAVNGAATATTNTRLAIDATNTTAATGAAAGLNVYNADLSLKTVTFTVSGVDASKAITFDITATDADANDTFDTTQTISVNGATAAAYADGTDTSAVADATGKITIVWAFTGTVGTTAGDLINLDLNVATGDVAATQTDARVTWVSPAYDVALTSPSATTLLVTQTSTVNFAGTLIDQFGNPLQGAVVTLNGPQTGTAVVAALTATATSDSTGKWSATLPAPAATTTQVVVTVTAVRTGATFSNNGSTYTINYTSTGNATTLTAVSNPANVLTAGVITGIPGITVPHDGVVTITGAAGLSNGVYTLATAATTADGGTAGTGADEYFTIVPTSTPAAEVTFTSDDSVYFSTATDDVAWNVASASKATGKFASGSTVRIWSTKAGKHTVTMNVGTTSTTQDFWVSVDANAARNLAITAPATLKQGEIGRLVVTATDNWGNPVAGVTAVGGIISATVTGQGTLGGGRITDTFASTDASGQAQLAIQAGNADGKLDFSVTAASTDFQFSSRKGRSVYAAGDTTDGTIIQLDASKGTVTASTTVSGSAAAATSSPEVAAVKADVKAVSDTVATLSKAVTTIQSSVTELTTSFTAQIKSLSSAIAKISRAIAALSKKIK